MNRIGKRAGIVLVSTIALAALVAVPAVAHNSDECTGIASNPQNWSHLHGNDWIDHFNEWDLADGKRGCVSLYGSGDYMDSHNEDDWIMGGTDPDEIYGSGGIDRIIGGGGGDRLLGGGAGPDYIWDGDGQDRINGGPGVDTLFLCDDSVGEESIDNVEDTLGPKASYCNGPG